MTPFTGPELRALVGGFLEARYLHGGRARDNTPETRAAMQADVDALLRALRREQWVAPHTTADVQPDDEPASVCLMWDFTPVPDPLPIPTPRERTTP